MVKRLKPWKGRETTLTIGDQIYQGVVQLQITTKVDSTFNPFWGIWGNDKYQIQFGGERREYIFQSEDGQIFPISDSRGRNHPVTAQNGGLVLKTLGYQR